MYFFLEVQTVLMEQGMRKWTAKIVPNEFKQFLLLIAEVVVAI